MRRFVIYSYRGRGSAPRLWDEKPLPEPGFIVKINQVLYRVEAVNIETKRNESGDVLDEYHDVILEKIDERDSS